MQNDRKVSIRMPEAVYNAVVELAESEVKPGDRWARGFQGNRGEMFRRVIIAGLETYGVTIDQEEKEYA